MQRKLKNREFKIKKWFTLLVTLAVILMSFIFVNAKNSKIKAICVNFDCAICCGVGPNECKDLDYCDSDPNTPGQQVQCGNNYPANQCQPGVYQCGDCPPDAGDIGDGACTWGDWTGCFGGNQSRCDNCGNCENRACGGCTVTQPSAAILQTPANNRLIATTTANLVWSNVSAASYGTGCPANNNILAIHYKPSASPGVCTGGGWIKRQIAWNSTTYAITGLNYSTEYCWRVRKRNGSAATVSAVRTFRTPTPPTVVTTSNLTDICGNRTTGRAGTIGPAGTPGTTNPVRFRAVTNKASNEYEFRYVTVAYLPTNGAYAGTALTESESSILTKVRINNTLAYRYDFVGGGYSSYSGGGGSWSWSPVSAAGTINALNTKSSLQNINAAGGSTNFIDGTGNTATTIFQIGLNNNFTAGLYNIYVMVVVSYRNGTQIISNDPSVSSLTNFRRMENWTIDMANPSASIIGPQGLGPNRFRMTFDATDAAVPGGTAAITELRSYVYADKLNTSLRNDTAPTYTLNPGTIPNATLSYPNAANAGLTLARVITSGIKVNDFTDLTPALNAAYTFKLAVRDRACNLTEITGGYQQSNPWFMAVYNSASSNGGYVDESPPAVTFNNPLNAYSTTSAAATDVIITGVVSLPSNNVSNQNKYATEYSNSAANPIKSSFTTWYEHLLDRASKAEGITVQTSGAGTVVGNISELLNSPGARNVVQVTNNLILNAGSRCNVSTIVFVQGNLTIRPDFTNLNNTTACIFVVSGNITVEPGTNKSAVALGAAGYSPYDQIEAFIIADGDMTYQLDNAAGPANKWDGLRFLGGVIANNITSQRDLNTSANQTQPAILFVYDARHREVFGDILNNRKYSIREEVE